MTKTRQPTITNNEIIKILEASPKIDITKYRHEMKNTWYDRTVWTNKHYISYRVPIEVYTKIVGKKFSTQRKYGDMVRVRSKTKRKWNRRSDYKQDVGDIYKWGHLGIGSGKNYESEETKGFGTYRGYGWNNNPYHNCKQVLTLGTTYICNKTAAKKKLDFWKNNPYIITEAPKWNQDVDIHNFYKVTTLEPTGLFGPKKLINGVISDVYVHWISPKWETKREARYHIKFETGAEGIFTADMLDKVYDTDFEVDDVLMSCEYKCEVSICRHKRAHNHDESCDKTCAKSGETCQTVFDYRELAETTIQRGLLDGEDEKTK